MPEHQFRARKPIDNAAIHDVQACVAVSGAKPQGAPVSSGWLSNTTNMCFPSLTGRHRPAQVEC